MPSSAELVCVDPARVHDIWPRVAPLLRAAIARTSLSAFDDIERDILHGHALLWLALGTSDDEGGCTILAAAATSLQQTDRGKVCVITACGGDNMQRWLSLIEPIEAYARGEGCARVRIFGRKGWLRVLGGYREKHVIMDKELG